MRLLTAASEVFAQKGYVGATVEAVCSNAGMSRRTFYQHFEDLGHALLELHDFAASTAFRIVEDAVRAETDAKEKLRAGIEAFFTNLALHGDLSRVLFREMRAAGPQHEIRLEAVRQRYAGLMAEGIAEAKAQGVASRAPDELTLYALVGAMEAVGMRYLSRREEGRAEEAIPAMAELIFRAFV